MSNRIRCDVCNTTNDDNDGKWFCNRQVDKDLCERCRDTDDGKEIINDYKEGWAEKTYANETIKRYLWDQINGCGLMAICPECGGSSISTCECARQRFYDRITDEMIEEGKKKMEEEKQDEL